MTTTSLTKPVVRQLVSLFESIPDEPKSPIPSPRMSQKLRVQRTPSPGPNSHTPETRSRSGSITGPSIFPITEGRPRSGSVTNNNGRSRSNSVNEVRPPSVSTTEVQPTAAPSSLNGQTSFSGGTPSAVIAEITSVIVEKPAMKSLIGFWESAASVEETVEIHGQPKVFNHSVASSRPSTSQKPPSQSVSAVIETKQTQTPSAPPALPKEISLKEEEEEEVRQQKLIHQQQTLKRLLNVLESMESKKSEQIPEKNSTEPSQLQQKQEVKVHPSEDIFASVRDLLRSLRGDSDSPIDYNENDQVKTLSSSESNELNTTRIPTSSSTDNQINSDKPTPEQQLPKEEAPPSSRYPKMGRSVDTIRRKAVQRGDLEQLINILKSPSGAKTTPITRDLTLGSDEEDDAAIKKMLDQLRKDIKNKEIEIKSFEIPSQEISKNFVPTRKPSFFEDAVTDENNKEISVTMEMIDTHMIQTFKKMDQYLKNAKITLGQIVSTMDSATSNNVLCQIVDKLKDLTSENFFNLLNSPSAEDNHDQKNPMQIIVTLMTDAGKIIQLKNFEIFDCIEKLGDLNWQEDIEGIVNESSKQLNGMKPTTDIYPITKNRIALAESSLMKITQQAIFLRSKMNEIKEKLDIILQLSQIQTLFEEFSILNDFANESEKNRSTGMAHSSFVEKSYNTVRDILIEQLNSYKSGLESAKTSSGILVIDKITANCNAWIKYDSKKGVHGTDKSNEVIIFYLFLFFYLFFICLPFDGECSSLEESLDFVISVTKSIHPLFYICIILLPEIH